MFCGKCGANIEMDVKFCPECGAPVVASLVEDASGNNKIGNGEKKKNKRPMIIGICAVVIILLIFVISRIGGSSELDGYYTGQIEDWGLSNLNYTLQVDGRSCHMYLTSRTMGMNSYRDYGEGTVKKNDGGYELDFEKGALREESPISVTISDDGNSIEITEGRSQNSFKLDRIDVEEFKDIMNKNY